MPAFYAHYRFGRDVLCAAPPQLRALCEKNRSLFDTGLHGPDLFFFYRPAIPNRVNKIGYNAHHFSGRAFLHRGRRVVCAARDREASMAYLCGLMCHFALDSTCHPCVHESMEKFGVSHAAVETALDRTLLLLDGFDPARFDPVAHLDTSRRAAAIIAPFYPPALTATVEKSLQSMIFYGRFLFNQNRALRAVTDKALYITFHHNAIFDMMMTPCDNPRCADSSKSLLELYDEALKAAQVLLEETLLYVDTGRGGSALFDKTFEG